MKRYRQKQSFESQLVANLLGSLWRLVSLPFRKPPSVDAVNIRLKSQEIRQMAQGSHEQIKLAVIQADNLVDLVLKPKVKGETMGERLKNGKSYFLAEIYNGAWEGHKVRNQLVHETNTGFFDDDLKKAVNNLLRAVNELI